MKQFQKEYIELLGYKSERFLIFNKHLSNMARKKEGHEMSVVEMEAPEDVEVLGIGCSMVLKKWADDNGLTEIHDKFMGGDLAGAGEVTAPVKSFNEKVDTFKNDQAEEVQEEEAVEEEDDYLEYDFTRFVHRHDYLIKYLKFEMDPAIGGYTNAAKNRFFDAKMVKDLVVPEDFKKYVKERMGTYYSYPKLQEGKPAGPPAPPSKMEVVKETVTEEIEEDFLPKEEPKKTAPELVKEIVQAENQEPTKILLATKINDLEALGFPLNKKKDGFLLDHGGGIQFDALNIIAHDEWPAFLLKYGRYYADFLEDQRTIRLAKDLEAVKKAAKAKREEKIIEPPKEVDTVIEVEKEEEVKPDMQMLDKDGKVVAEATIKLEPDNEVIHEMIEQADREDEEDLVDAVAAYRKDHPEVEVSGITAVSSVGFFSKLLSYKFHTVQLTFVRLDDEKIRLTVKPSSELKDDAFLDLSPMNLTGTAEDFDREFFEAIDKPLAATQKLFARSDEYLKELKKAEKKAKVEADAKKAIKDAVEAAEKYAGGEKVTKPTLTKKWEAVIEVDPDNKKAKEELDKISQGEIEFK